jgi:hypothetical protein
MIDPKTYQPPQSKTVPIPKSSPAKVTAMPDLALSRDRIRDRAYELYEGRGCVHGQDEHDWLRAEEEIIESER